MNQINQKLLEAADILSAKPLLRRVEDDALVVGDLHGDIDSLEYAIKKRKELGARYLVLLGDYIDRGNHQFEVLDRVLDLILEDKYCVALRGNHETEMIYNRMGFAKILSNRGGDQNYLNQFFKNLPIATRSSTIFYVHGGLPIAIDKFDPVQINQLPREKDLDGSELVEQLLWNDPLFVNPEQRRYQYSPRGGIAYLFGKDITTEFLSKWDLNYVIRAHSAIRDGLRYTHDNKLVSLFSSASGRYEGFSRMYLQVKGKHLHPINYTSS